MFDLAGLEDAHRVVARAMGPTPQYRWPTLCRSVGCEVWVKHENHTPIGAFKVRGGLVLFDELDRAGRLPERIVTATRGNHGQSIPFTARRYGIPVTVLVPRGNSVEKNEAMLGWGAELVEFGDDFEEARMEAERRAAPGEAYYVPSFHPALVRGVATYAHELFGAVRDLDTVYVPIGMGSGICGVIRTRDLMGLSTEVVGVVAARAPAVARSVAAGRIVTTDTCDTFADGMAVPHAPRGGVRGHPARRRPDRRGQRGRDRRRDARALSEHPQPRRGRRCGGVRGAASGRGARRAGGRVGVILSGGNVDASVFRIVLAGEVP